MTNLDDQRRKRPHTLRDRIAAAIYGAASQWDSYPWDALAGHIQALYLGQADAVIAVLIPESVNDWKDNDV
jgi:hypothetical protein